MCPIFDDGGQGDGGGAADYPDPSNVRKGVVYGNGTLTGTYDPFTVAGGASDLGAMYAALSGLQTYLQGISGLTVLTEFPYANQALTFPSLTLTAGTPKRTPLMPEIIAVTEPDGNHQVVATEVTAEYDASIQLDLWCSDKLQRAQYLKKILDAFNAQEVDASGNNNPDGISLTLSSYYNVIARYEIDTHTHVDDEAAAQRQERRERIMVLVNLREVKQRTYYAMVTIEQQNGVGTGTEIDDFALETYDDPTNL